LNIHSLHNKRPLPPVYEIAEISPQQQFEGNMRMTTIITL
jgi:hypothetical protein